MNFSLLLSLQLILSLIPTALTLQPYQDFLDPSIFLPAWLPISLFFTLYLTINRFYLSDQYSHQILPPKISALNPHKDCLFYLMPCILRTDNENIMGIMISTLSFWWFFNPIPPGNPPTKLQSVPALTSHNSSSKSSSLSSSPIPIPAPNILSTQNKLFVNRKNRTKDMNSSHFLV